MPCFRFAEGVSFFACLEKKRSTNLFLKFNLELNEQEDQLIPQAS